MLLILSPAKALNFEGAPKAPLTTPQLKDDIAELAKTTCRLRTIDLKRLMDLSDNLAELNRARFQAFDPECDSGVQAAFAFNGDVYQGLSARTLDRRALTYAQEHVRILSGLYGVLRPLDAIQPYRLEMGVALKTGRGPTLYKFWGDKIAGVLDEAVEDHRDPTIVNLASQEYFGAVDRKALKAPVINCHFREDRPGGSKVISFFAKRARGMMARYAIDNRVKKASQLKGFDVAGYAFDNAASSEDDWVFVRPEV